MPRHFWNGTPHGDPEGVKPALQADLSGRTVLVVGATTGIGLELAKHFAKMGPRRLILTGRNVEKCKAMEDVIRKETGFAAVEAWPLELDEFASIKTFVDRFEEDGDDLDLFVQNAAVATGVYALTQDGYESSIQVNHLSAALLTTLLLPRLLTSAQKKGTLSRAIIVGSGIHYISALTQNPFPSDVKILDTMSTEEYCIGKNGMLTRYADSKLFSVLLVRALQTQIPSSAPLLVTSVDPGFCKSDLMRHIPDLTIFAEPLKMARTAEEGSRQLLYAALGPDPAHLDSLEATTAFRGGYIADAEVQGPSEWVQSEDGAKLQGRIWDETWEILNKLDARIANVPDALRR